MPFLIEKLPGQILPGQFLIIQSILFLSDVAFCFQCFGTENSSACSTSYSVVGKSYEFVIYEGDKKFKRMYQAASPEEQKTFGYDFPNDADAHDLEIVSAMEEWLRDGKPVD